MAKPQSGFGKFPVIGGKAWQGQSSAIPLPLLQQMAKSSAIPITVSTLTVSLKGSTTNPVPLWIGNDFVEVRESVDYTITPGTNTVFLNSSGVTVAAQVTGASVYYMYAGLDTAGAIQFYPSHSAPSSVQGPFESSNVWSHPGTTRGKHWAYCGFFQASTTVPALTQFEKRGFTYYSPTPTACGVNDFAKDTSIAASQDFSTLVPKHGVECSGWATGATDAVGTVTWIGSTSLAVQQFAIPCISLHIVHPEQVNFGPVTPDTNGYLWGAATPTTAAGATVNITTIKDVV